jgi:hypothetical protein
VISAQKYNARYYHCHYIKIARGELPLKPGHLSQYFSGVAMKRLSAVEADLFASNQHEFNGTKGLKALFGDGTDKQTFPARFIYLNDHEDDPPISDGYLSWYANRINHAHRKPEHRLYFPTTTVSDCAAEGDLLVLARQPDGTVLVVIAEDGSTISNQIIWLFGLSDLTHPGFSVRGELESEQDRIEFTSRFILEQIGIVVETSEETHLDSMLQKFGGGFPSTRDFSAYARSTIENIDASSDPDTAVMAWMEREEILFRTLERHIIGDRLTKGFNDDVEGFISFSLSVQNRRKSRVGLALENHLELVFIANALRYKRTGVTENKSKPDFLFPGITEYKNAEFNPLDLTMLGVKSTCKDRWRQVLAEANRIERKHLLTLETAISDNQTNEMREKSLQLVLPRRLHSTYNAAQQTWLLDLASFVEIVRTRQARMGL